MMYADEATAELEWPVATAMALIVSDADTVIAAKYLEEDVVGVAPFVV